MFLVQTEMSAISLPTLSLNALLLIIIGVWGKEMAGSLDETKVCIDNYINLLFIRRKIAFKYMILCALGLIAITLSFVGELTYNIICSA